MQGKRGRGRPRQKAHRLDDGTDTGNSRKRHNIENSGVVGHLDLPGGRSPKEEVGYRSTWSANPVSVSDSDACETESTEGREQPEEPHVAPIFFVAVVILSNVFEIVCRMTELHERANARHFGTPADAVLP